MYWTDYVRDLAWREVLWTRKERFETSADNVDPYNLAAIIESDERRCHPISQFIDNRFASTILKDADDEISRNVQEVLSIFYFEISNSDITGT